MKFLALLGAVALNIIATIRSWFEELGRGLLMFQHALVWLVRPPYRYRVFIAQIDFIGVQSVELICVTGAFTGMVLALQADAAMNRFGAQSLIGAAVALSLARELGPVLAALLVTGRAGSAITAELGSMRSTDQIDALASMAVEPIQYLVAPRMVAAVLVMPMLTIIFEFTGMVGAYVVVTTHLKMEGGVFMAGVKDYLDYGDLIHGLVKAGVFGLVFSLVSCMKGFFATGGSRGVGLATTRAVVVSSLLTLASDYAMTAIMLRL
ncbi:MAG: ABC transporter permease [Pseudomonadota bacterium]